MGDAWMAGGAEARQAGGALPWRAGDAVVADPSKSPWLSRSVRLAGAILFGVARGIAIAAVATQIPTTAMQLWEEHALAGPISSMKAEQAWLVGQGLAMPRRIGAMPEGYFQHTGIAGRETQMQGVQQLWGGIDPSFYLLGLDGWVKRLTGASMIPVSFAISVGAPGSLSEGFQAIPSFVYRHEEAHALARDFDVEPGTPKTWPAEVSKAVALELSHKSMDAQAGKAPWRSALLESLWSESFADAYGVLSDAKRGAADFKATALAVSSGRAMKSSKEDPALSALDAAGNGHAVDMASFLAGQLDPGQVGKLGGADLRALAADIADASLAWAVARQAPALGFFEGQGPKWWSSVAAKAGLDPKQADLAWARWAKQSQQERPDDAFGSLSWTHGGVEFRAKGLDASASRDWRFDGYGGTIGLRGVLDLPEAAPQEARRKGGPPAGDGLDGPDGSAPGRASRGADADEIKRAWRRDAFDAAAAERLLLAKRMGLPMAPQMEALAKVKASLFARAKAAPASGPVPGRAAKP